jgi:hypothetical protein
MAFDLENFMEAEKFTETKRQRIREFAKHSISFYKETGEHIPHPFDKENLLAVLMGMERYIIDSNLPGSVSDAKKPGNKNKAFILGQTFTDEHESLKDALLRSPVDNSNNNLFAFGFVGDEIRWLPTPCLMLYRLDSYLQITMNAKGLREESRSPAKRMLDDPEFIASERKDMADVLHFKGIILKEILRWPDITCLPPVEFNERKRAQLIEIIRSKAPSCFTNYLNANYVASLCYAALLLESDKIGVKTRNEFCQQNRRNVFGDTRLIQNALWLKARILSNDRAVTRMVEYLGRAALGLDPFVEVRLAFDGEKTARHGRVAVAAKLGAVDLVAADLGGREPDRNTQAGNGVLTDAHGDDFQRVNHVLRLQNFFRICCAASEKLRCRGKGRPGRAGNQPAPVEYE